MFEVTYENPRWLLDRIEKRLKERDLKKKNKTKQKKQIAAKRSVKKWLPKDTKFLCPTLTEEEAKMAWEEGW